MPLVSIEKCPDYSPGNVAKALRRVFDGLGGAGKFIRPGMKVILKPNLLMAKKPGDAVTTHPAVVAGLALIVREAGGRAIIADSPAGPFTPATLRAIYSECGMIEAAERSGAALNYDVSIVEMDNPRGRLLKKVPVMKALAEAGLVINIPKLKTHGQMVYTGAVKNMFGSVPGVGKPEFHLRMAEHDMFADALIDIFLSLRPGLSVMDAVTGMEGNGPSAGTPVQIGLLLGSEDAFALDSAALNIVNTGARFTPVGRRAIERGLAAEDPGNLEISGEPAASVRIESFDMPGLERQKSIIFFEKGILRRLAESLKPAPIFDFQRCAGCGDCARACPAHIIEMKKNKAAPDLSRCIRCFCCQEICPMKAVSIKKPFLTPLVLRAGVFVSNHVLPFLSSFAKSFSRKAAKAQSKNN